MKNENAQVLDPAQNPIPRLYAAGCFDNFQSHTYGITGGNNAENQVWGRIAPAMPPVWRTGTPSSAAGPLATAVRARAAGLRPIREENGRLSADR